MTRMNQGTSRQRRAVLTFAASAGVILGGFAGLAGLRGSDAHAQATPTGTATATETQRPKDPTASATATDTATATSTATASATATATSTPVPAGSITIMKDAGGAAGSVATFSTTGGLGGDTGLQLDDDPDTAMLNTRTFTGLGGGSYSVTEGVTANWALQSITCDSKAATIDLAGRTIVITTAGDPNVTCIFHNASTQPPGQGGSITITKTFVGSVDPNLQAAFTTSGASLVGFSLANGGSRTFAGLAAGNYSIMEGAVFGWPISSIVCDDAVSAHPVPGGGFVDITLGENMAVTCTFFNALATAPILPNGNNVTVVPSTPAATSTTAPSNVETPVPTETATVPPATATTQPNNVETPTAATGESSPSAPAGGTGVTGESSAVAGVGVPGAPQTGTGQAGSDTTANALFIVAGLLAITGGAAFVGARRLRR